MDPRQVTTPALPINADREGPEVRIVEFPPDREEEEVEKNAVPDGHYNRHLR